ncbi:MAG: tetratricopeptide repeat protein, partial [Gammaproteobacteria bacterium]|nr:tetratricopeptide repeat protein [Gammaproteobacteria bacterium]
AAKLRPRRNCCQRAGSSCPLALWWVWTDYLFDIRTHRASDNPVVAVLPIANLSGKAELDWLGEGLANLVRTDLAQSRHVVVVSNSRWESITRGLENPEQKIEAAREAGIEYVFGGEFISTPAGLLLSVRLSDILNGVEKAARSFDQLTPEAMLGTGYQLSILSKQGLEIPHTQSVDSFAADFVVNNMTAYEAYVGGLGFFRRFKYQQAEQAMSAALALADGFHIARYRLAHIYMSTGRQSEAVATVEQIPVDAVFSERERLYVDAAKALFSYELDSAIETYKKLLELYPFEVEARQFLAEVYFQNYQESKAVDELRILALQEPENEFIWGSMGTYLLLSGNLDDAEKPLSRYLELALEKAHPLTMLGDLHRQRGNFEEAASYYEQALQANPEFAEARRGSAQVLTILGDVDKAKSIWQEIIADETIPADERIYAAFDFAWVLRSEGRFRESLLPLETLRQEIEQERIREAMALSTRALSHMELGETERARELLALAMQRNQSDVPTRVLFARGLLELHEGALDSALATAREIRGHALPPDNTDRTESRAADYLEGLALLGKNEVESAVSTLSRIFESDGYDYAVYELGLATAMLAGGNLDEALKYAERAAGYRDAAEIRLDLEVDRVRAGLVQARIRQQQGKHKDASLLAQAFLDKWAAADRPSAESDSAQRLANR